MEINKRQKLDNLELCKVKKIHNDISPSDDDSIAMRSLDNKVEYNRVESGKYFDSNHSTIKSHNDTAYLVGMRDNNIV